MRMPLCVTERKPAIQSLKVRVYSLPGPASDANAPCVPNLAPSFLLPILRHRRLEGARAVPSSTAFRSQAMHPPPLAPEPSHQGCDGAVEATEAKMRVLKTRELRQMSRAELWS